MKSDFIGLATQGDRLCSANMAWILECILFVNARERSEKMDIRFQGCA